MTMGDAGLIEAAGTGSRADGLAAGDIRLGALRVQHHTARLVPGDRRFDAIELPVDLRNAVPRRQLHFRAGRFCAAEALRRLGVAHWAHPLRRGRDGCPAWPDGVVGSITHTDGYAAAAVALTGDVLALGLDTERLVPEARARLLEGDVAEAGELAHARAAGCDRGQAFTLVFSAKESIFKALYPLVGRRFGFRAVQVVAVDPLARRFGARVVCALSDRVAADTMLEGRFEIESAFVHTAVALPAKQTGSRNHQSEETSHGTVRGDSQ